MSILVEQVRDKHIAVLRAYLEGAETNADDLWLSISYFCGGVGRIYLLENKPFTQDEWRLLLGAVGRNISKSGMETCMISHGRRVGGISAKGC